MNLIVTGRHVEVTNAMRGYVATKLERIKRHFDDVVDVRVTLTVEKVAEKERRQKAECFIHVKGGEIVGESSKEDMYAAVDELMDKMDKQVVKHKTKLQKHQGTAKSNVN